MATTVARLQAVLSANTRDFDQGMDRSHAKAKGFSTGVTKAALFAGAGVVLGLGKAVSAAAGFEQSLNTLQAVTGATGSQLDEFRKLSIKLGADTKLPATSAADAAAAMTELSKAGLSVADAMGAARPVLILSAAATIDNAQAAEIAANALNAFGLQGKDAALVADELANTANASSVEITDVADSFKMAAAVFSGFQAPVIGAKKAMTELNVAIGILGNMGIKGSDAGTSLKQMLLQLTGPSAKAKDGMKALWYASQGATISSDQLTDAIANQAQARGAALGGIEHANKGIQLGGDIAYTASGKMRPLKEIIDLVTKGTAKMTQEQRNSYLTQIFGADATRAVIALMKAGTPEWDKMTAAVQRRGAAEELAAAKMKGFKGTVEAAKSAIETLEITIGTGLLPIMTTLAGILAKVANLASAHATATKVAIGAIAAFSAVVLTTNLAMKAAAAAQVFWTAVTKSYRAAVISATAAQWAFNVAVRANPFVAAATAIAVLVAALVILQVKYNAVTNAVKWLSHHLWALLAIPVVGEFAAIAIAIDKTIKHWDSISSAVAKLVGWLKDAVHYLKTLIGWLGKIPDIHMPSLPGIGDASFGGSRDPSRGAGMGKAFNVGSQLWDEIGMGISRGMVVTSGYRKGARTKHGTPSDHGYFPSRAVDMAGTPSMMSSMFKALIGRREIAQAFYDPLGSIFNGVRSSYVEGGHSDHIHIAEYDKGGFLRPGWNLAYNGLGRPEPVGGNITIPVSIGGENVATVVFDMLRRKAKVFENRNGRPAFGGT